MEQARNLGHLHENRRQWEEENEEEEGVINCPDPNIARASRSEVPRDILKCLITPPLQLQIQ